MKKQILPAVITLCFVKAIGNARVTHIFPFIASYLLSIGVTPKDVPVYAGLAEALISIGDLVFMPLHVMLVRRYSHRYVMSVALVVSGALAGIFGFCDHAWQILALRGMVSPVHIGGYVATIALGEIVDDETRGEAFSWFAGADFIGTMAGSVLGAYLSEPATHIPALSNFTVLAQYPFALPGIAIMIMTASTALAVMAWVEETNPRYKKVSENEDSEPSTQSTSSRRLTVGMLFRSSYFWQLSAVEFSARVCFFGFLALLSTAGKLSPAIGGLGLEIGQIGHVLFVAPLLASVNLLFLFKRYSQYIRTRYLVMIASSAWCLPAIFFPLAANLTSATHEAPAILYVLWYGGHAITMSWWALRSLINATLYPDPDDRALSLAILRQSTNLGCIVGATGFGKLFSFSTQYPAGSLGRQTVWIAVGAVTIVTALIGFTQQDIDGPDPIVQKTLSEDQDETAPLLPGGVERE